MNMQKQLVDTAALARRIEDDWRLPAEARERGANIRKLCESMKPAAFALRDYDLDPSEPIPPRPAE
ncbi:TPA: hypothetical protein ACNVWL_003553 [Pseudomonas aeruginosa]|uniref:hypothetical protein n=1 Tax=Pseudomonas aeruginosa TaxID=287 RepID=UPI0023595B2E|nr:hypothetical protein [Pseudomonas aeruginosa]WEO43441.1 hypothetical protein PUL49_08395 [Pseudomonas aeruginosa]